MRRGDLVIHGIPEKARKGVVRSFAKLTGATEEKVEKLLTSLPATITRNITEERAASILGKLKQIGVEATFEPNPSPLPHEPEQPPKPTKTTKEKKPKKKRSFLVAVGRILLLLLLIFGGIAAWGYYQIPREMRVQLQSAGINWLYEAGAGSMVETAQTMAKESHTPKEWLTLEWREEAPLEEQVWLRHAPPIDWRLLAGFREAVATMGRLFGDAADPPKVSVVVRQQTFEESEVTFTVKQGWTSHDYPVRLTARPGHMRQNLDTLATLLGQVSADFDGLTPPGGITPLPPVTLANVVAAEKSLRLGDVFAAIEAIRGSLAPEGFAPATLYTASRLLSWLAFGGSFHDYQGVTDTLTIPATALWLVALQGGESGPYDDGMLLLGMGYPAEAGEALAPLDPSAPLVAQGVKAYADRDMAKLAYLAETEEDPIFAYLLARGTPRTGAPEETDRLYDLIYADDGFLMGREWASSCGCVGPMRAAERGYLSLLSTQLLSAYDTIAEPGWASRILKTVTTGTFNNQFGEWLRLMAITTQTETATMRPRSLLAKGFLIDYLRESVLLSADLTFNLYQGALGSPEEARQVMEMVEESFPDADLLTVWRLRSLNDSGKWKEAWSMVQTLEVNRLDRASLMQALTIHLPSQARPIDLPKAFALVNRLHDLVPLNEKGARDYADAYKMLTSPHLESRYLDYLVSLEPYDVGVYFHLATLTDTVDAFDRGLPYVGSSARFWNNRAWWLQRKKEYQKAFEALDHSIALAPQQWTAYNYKVLIAQERKECDDIIATGKSYPDFEGTDLRAAKLQVAVAECLDEKGERKEALRLLRKAARTGSGWANDALADHLEKRGKIADAEAIYTAMVRRYPQSGAPATLAMFYLRQGDRAKGIETLQEGLKQNSMSFYFRSAIEHFRAVGDQDRLIPFVEEVIGKPLDPLTAYALADYLIKYDEPKRGVETLLTYPTVAIDPIKPLTLAYNTLLMNRLATPEEARNQILKELTNDTAREGFAIALVGEGEHDLAFHIFATIFDHRQRRRDVEVVLMGISYLGGEKTDEKRQAILSRLPTAGLSPWQGKLIAYALGETTETDLYATTLSPREACEASLITGLKHLQEGDREGAVARFMATLDTGASENIEYWYAFKELERVGPEKVER